MFCSKEQVLHSFGKKEITCYWTYIKNQIFVCPNIVNVWKNGMKLVIFHHSAIGWNWRHHWLFPAFDFLRTSFGNNRTFGQWNVLGLLKCHQIFSWLISTLSFLRPMLHFWWRIQRWRNTARFTQKEKIHRKQA